MKRARYSVGSVVFDKRRKVWNFLFWEDGHRRTRTIGTLRDYPTKGEARRAAEVLRHSMESPAVTGTPTVSALVEQYRLEKMPQRFSTRYSYNQWLDNHVLPRWGKCAITGLQARPVELWLQSLELSPKSRAAIRGLLSIIWDFAMWAEHVPTQRNPMELVAVKGVTKRTRQPRSLTAEEFHKFVQHLDEPFRSLALVCLCLGLRISEALALRWSDVDWLNGRLRVERGIVRQHLDDVKTVYSQKAMPLDSAVLALLKAWKQATQFGADSDWIFASPFKLGRLPWSYPWVWRVFQNAAKDAGIGKLGTHTMWHTFRAWLEAIGTPLGVQRELMRHSSIKTTLDIYGRDLVTPEMSAAASKITGLAFN